MNISNSSRGSVLITALIFAAIIAISLTSFLKLALSAPKLANRSFYANAAQNLADTGLEQALYSVNSATGLGTNSDGFTARSGFANQYQGTFPSRSTYYTLSQGVKGQVKVWVDASTSTRQAVALATVTLADGSTIIKMSEAYLKQRSTGTLPMVARDGLSFNGNVTLDSWDSNSDTGTTADDVRYSNAVRNTNAGVASTSVTVANVALQNADVYGRAAVGTDDSSAISVGAGGRLAGNFAAGTGIDFSRVTYDFTTSFPEYPVPTNGGTSVSTINSNYSIDPGVATTRYYYVNSISLSGNKTLEIGPATVDASHPAVDIVMVVSGAITVGGASSLVINPGSKLQIYAAGDVDFGGNGVSNGGATYATSNNPINFQIFGTRSAADAASMGMQQINVKGTSYLSAVINVPNGDVFINGTADAYGAVLANRIRMVGSGNFHADESLGRTLTLGIWGVTKWRELATSSERNTYQQQVIAAFPSGV